MTNRIDEARVALDLIRRTEHVGDCSHPAEALVRSDMLLVWQCSACGTGVGDERVARIMEQWGRQ